VVDGAVVYWLEDDAGRRLGPESARSLAPMFLALDLAENGRDADSIRLCARLESGERFELGGGPSLIGVAEAAAGIPRRPRTPGIVARSRWSWWLATLNATSVPAAALLPHDRRCGAPQRSPCSSRSPRARTRSARSSSYATASRRCRPLRTRSAARGLAKPVRELGERLDTKNCRRPHQPHQQLHAAACSRDLSIMEAIAFENASR
jgi:hypothetical protein